MLRSSVASLTAWSRASRHAAAALRPAQAGFSNAAAGGQLKVAIVGAGVAGPVLALLLQKHLGCTPVVFEQAHAIKEVGAGISLAPNGLRVLASLGLPGLASLSSGEQGEAIQRFLVTRPNDSTIVEFPTMAQQSYGYPMTGVRRSRLLSLLLDALDSRGISLQLGKRLAGIEQEQQQGSGRGRPLLQFEDGSSHEADLVVGCDGLRSATRRAIKASSEPPPAFTGEEVVFAVTIDRNADLVPPNTCTMQYGRGRQHFGAYGLGPDCSWFTSSRASSSRDTWGPVRDAAEVEQVKAELADRYRGWGLVQRMLDRDVAVMIRVGIFDRETPHSWSKGVVTLAGDAASPIPPNLGQGGNKALEDVAVLAACLRKHAGDIPAALALYERLRSARSAALLNHSRRAAEVANLDHPAAIAARNGIIRGLVALRGTIPSGWMWSYDADAAVAAAAT